MAKIKINKLPKGFKLVDGKVVEDKLMQRGGGLTSGDQADYGLVTTPEQYYGLTNFNNTQDETVRYSLGAVPRDEANLEAEGGETVLTDLNNDGMFGLYNITGPRHNRGGVPMFLPEQSFVFSDTRALRMSPDEMQEFGIGGSRKTPAVLSRRFGLQDYYAELDSQYADDISARSAELMLQKNMGDLSKLAFIQEAKKDFQDGVPLASYPYLASIGEDPIAFTAKMEEISEQKAQERAFQALPPEQQQQILMLQEFMAQQQMSQEGVPPQGMEQQMQPQQPTAQQQELGMAMANNDMLMTAQFGTEMGDFLGKAGLTKYQKKGETASQYAKRKGQSWPEGAKDPTFDGKVWQFPDGTPPLDKQAARTLAIAVATGSPIPPQYMKDTNASDNTESSTQDEEVTINENEELNTENQTVEVKETETVSENQVDKVESGNNPFKEGSANYKKHNEYVNGGYTPTIITENGKKRVKYVRPATEFDYSQYEDRLKNVTKTEVKGSDGKTYSVYSDDVTGQQQITNESGAAIFIPGLYSASDSPVTQYSNKYGFGSDEFFNEKSEEDFYFRNKAIIDKIPDFQFRMKRDADGDGKTDQAYIDNWSKFQNAYEDERKKYMEAQGLTYIPYFISDEEYKANPEKYDKDGDGKIDDDFKKRRLDGKAGVFTINAPGFDTGYEPGDTQYLDIPDDPTKPPPPKDTPLPPREWWQQDINNLLTLNAIDDELFLPWAPELEDQKIDYVLDDYTGRVNANLAAQNVMANALGAYGPQAIARSDIQGKTLDANAKAINQVNQNNVRTMNRVAALQPQLDMKVDMANAKTQKGLYDDTVTALQQAQNFDNWKTAKYNELYNTGLTNAANTYNLNTLYDTYNVDPRSGGYVEFTPDGRMLYKDSSADQAQLRIDRLQKLEELFPGKAAENYPLVYGDNANATEGMTRAQVEAQQRGGFPSYSPTGNVNVNQGKKGTEVKKKYRKAFPFSVGQMGY